MNPKLVLTSAQKKVRFRKLLHRQRSPNDIGTKPKTKVSTNSKMLVIGGMTEKEFDFEKEKKYSSSNKLAKTPTYSESKASATTSHTITHSKHQPHVSGSKGIQEIMFLNILLAFLYCPGKIFN